VFTETLCARGQSAMRKPWRGLPGREELVTQQWCPTKSMLTLLQLRDTPLCCDCQSRISDTVYAL
jgi:hypothetical protein